MFAGLEACKRTSRRGLLCWAHETRNDLSLLDPDHLKEASFVLGCSVGGFSVKNPLALHPSSKHLK